MNIIPTIEGGLRVDIEDPSDWLVLRHLIEDPQLRGRGLADELGGLIDHPEIRDDWQEFVVPDLETQFCDSIGRVGKVIVEALEQCKGGPGSLWITREDGHDWFSVLNQARLAIEDRYQFGNRSQDDLELLDDSPRQSAWYRSQFYSAVQGLLLDHVLN